MNGSPRIKGQAGFKKEHKASPTQVATANENEQGVGLKGEFFRRGKLTFQLFPTVDKKQRSFRLFKTISFPFPRKSVVPRTRARREAGRQSFTANPTLSMSGRLTAPTAPECAEHTNPTFKGDNET